MTLDGTLLLAIATFVLAGGAFGAIWQTYRLQEKDRQLHFRLRLLDEVQDWARECVKFGFLYGRHKVRSKHEMFQLTDMYEDIAKNIDVTVIASDVFGNKLKKPIEDAVAQLKKFRSEPSTFANKDYYDSYHELLAVVIDLKKTLYSIK